jgi:hypothetical protein
VNRDLSIAVLRAFAAKRQEEHELELVKKATSRSSKKGLGLADKSKGNGNSQAEETAAPAPAPAPAPEDTNLPADDAMEAVGTPDQKSESRDGNPESSPVQKAEEDTVTAVESTLDSTTAKPLHILEVQIGDFLI